MSDEYISKQKVLDYLNGYLHSLGYDNTDLLVNGQRKALINAIQDISAVKAADVQPVVRCKDCIYLNRHDCPMAYIEHQTLQFAAVTPDFYCAKGADHEP